MVRALGLVALLPLSLAAAVLILPNAAATQVIECNLKVDPSGPATYYAYTVASYVLYDPEGLVPWIEGEQGSWPRCYAFYECSWTWPCEQPAHPVWCDPAVLLLCFSGSEPCNQESFSVRVRYGEDYWLYENVDSTCDRHSRA